MGARNEVGRARARLKRVGQRIERWRWTRTKRGAMPATLWAEATDLGRELGAYRVARELGIGYQSLRDRLGEDAEVGPPDGQRFVEINTASLFAAPAPTARGEVELSDTSGVKIVIRLGAGDRLDVGALLAALRASR